VEQWRAHDCVRGLSAIKTKKELISIGFDHLVRIWSLDGILLGNLRQGDAVQEEWLFEPAAEEKYRALKLEAADVMQELAADEESPRSPGGRQHSSKSAKSNSEKDAEGDGGAKKTASKWGSSVTPSPRQASSVPPSPGA